MSAKTVYLMRHGEVQGSGQALYGRTDVALCESGWNNMCRQAEYLVELDHLITSPLQRCARFAEHLAQSRHLPLLSEARLAECDFGDVDGVPFELLQSQWSMLEMFWHQPGEYTLPGAESLQAMFLRVTAAWSSILELDAKRLLLITHGGVIRLLLAHLLAWDWRNGALYSQLRLANASITKVTLGDNPSSIPVVQCIGWLGGELHGI